jgi:hypothetical protein
MSEREDLEHSALLEKTRQTVERVSTYLDELTANIEEAKRKQEWSRRIYFAAWVVWILLPIWYPNLYSIFTILFFFALIYDSVVFSQVVGAYKEFFGAIKMLELLGYFEPRDRGNTQRKKRFWEKGIEIVRGWATKKKELQDKAFSPA